MTQLKQFAINKINKEPLHKRLESKQWLSKGIISLLNSWSQTSSSNLLPAAVCCCLLLPLNFTPVPAHNASWLYFTEEIYQTRSLNVNFGLMCSGLWNIHFPVSSQQFWVELTNSELVHSRASAPRLTDSLQPAGTKAYGHTVNLNTLLEEENTFFFFLAQFHGRKWKWLKMKCHHKIKCYMLIDSKRND